MSERSQSRLPTGASPGRRHFLKRAAGLVGGLLGALLGLPLVWLFVDDIYRKAPLRYARVGSIASFPVGEPQKLRFTLETQEAYLLEQAVHDVWVIKQSDTQVTVFSAVCPHAGCHYDWQPARREFVCPCHNSIFSLTGRVLGGPAPRPLDTLPYRMENGVLYVEWEQFRVGIPQKVRV